MPGRWAATLPINALESSASVETTGSVLVQPLDHSVEHEDAPARPANAARSIFHVLSGVVSLLFTLVVFTPYQLVWVAGSIAATFWTLEALRRPFPRFNVLLMRVFRPIAHAAEAHRINSATWYMTALTILAATQSKLLCVVGVAVLGFGDPAASLVGRRFGRIVLLRGRTFEGALGFIVAGTITTTVVLLLTTGHLPFAFVLLVAFAASLAGAVAELLSRRLDDNLTIPLAAGSMAAVLLLLSGRGLW